ncbi:MAG: DUF2452 domain-containing protein [Blastochloris sp.]|jgi:DNA-binding transcriptional regulator YbjK|nr:DUF2452 domain-containing protein [Blastochloris sp.]
MNVAPPDAAPDDMILSALSYAHQRGGFIVRPEDMGKVKGKALEAMEYQVETQLKQIYQQVETLAKQAKILKDRATVSYRIYQSEIRSEPVINQLYYLYERSSGTTFLSLISPEEWSSSQMKFLAKTRLLADHTWEVIDSPIDV